MPRTMTITKTVFKLDELDDALQHKAHEKWTQHNLDYEWWDHMYDMFVQAAELIGISIDTRPVKLMGGGTRQEPKIQFSGFWSQGDGACFVGDYSYQRGALAKIKAEFPEDTDLHDVATALQACQRRFFYGLKATVKHQGRYSHSHSNTISVWHADDEYRDIGLAEDEIATSLRDFMDWMYRALEKEYEYLQSFEQFKESCEANEYEFDEHGNIA